jgi:hypothetical protein
MNKALSIVLVTAVAAGIIPLARSIETWSLPPGVATANRIPMGEAHPAECPNARHTPLYGI